MAVFGLFKKSIGCIPILFKKAFISPVLALEL
jgi:hypothetical protein